jgi:hypothetical protein
MSQESPRLDRIENIVTVLEVDIKTMSKAVTELAGSVKQLVVLQTDQQLLKQEAVPIKEELIAELPSYPLG